MCTVTFVPYNKGFFLTSSRDETAYRPTLPPRWREHKQSQLLYPQDTVALGSWIGVSDDNRLACLLNGAFSNHIKNPKGYRKSRGAVLIESFQYEIKDFLNGYDLYNVEPFTLLLLEINPLKFYELVWDGLNKHIRPMDVNQSHLWSSSTLYDYEAKQRRKSWFNDWCVKNINPNSESIFNFHASPHGTDVKNDILMKREDGLQTVSISQFVSQENDGVFRYKDLIKDNMTSHQIKIGQTV